MPSALWMLLEDLSDGIRMAAELYGYSFEEMRGRSAFSLYEDKNELERMLMHLRQEGSVKKWEMEMNRKDGSIASFELSIGLLQDSQKRTLGSVCVARDLSGIKGAMAALKASNEQLCQEITERKQAEEETDRLKTHLFKAQKLEAIGTLAGGIAHDFNNILSIIMGYTELARLKFQENENAEQYIKEVLKACRRAKDLIRQLLSFSHSGDKLERQVLYVRPIIKEVAKFLKALLPSTIEIQQSIGSETGIVFAHPTQIHQVLTNLCTNAAHAMEKAGGILEISLADVDA